MFKTSNANKIHSNGKKYIGEWIDNKRDGFGTNVWPDGSKYIGEWKEGKQNGVGTFTFSNGAKDVGEWKENKLNGEAIQYFANGNIFRQGVFRDDQFLYEKYKLNYEEKQHIERLIKDSSLL